MVNQTELTDYLDAYLRINEIDDYGPQGLQVEAVQPTIERLALAVDVAPPIITAAADWGADMLLVHHGILWRSVERIAGPLGERVRLFLGHKMHLYAAHLPLDAHPEVGNNAVLADMAGITVESWWCEAMGTPVGVYGTAVGPLTRDQLRQTLQAKLASEVRLLPHGPEQVKNVAIVSGFGADQVAAAKALGADTFITGETSHANYWAAADYGLNVLYAGHYASETVGVKALGAHLAAKFAIETKFFDFPTNM